jgi:HlyD family secretion protein
VDIPRDPKPKKRRRMIQIAVAAGIVLMLTVGINRLNPAAPSVDQAQMWFDTVQRGTMVRQVRGPGTLVPEQMRWITAVTAGRVEEILVLPGTNVTATTPIIRLTNPDVEVEALRAQQQLSDAEANLISLRTQLETGRLTQEGVVAQTRALYLEAKRTWENNKTLYETNPELVAEAEYQRSREALEDLETRLSIEERRLTVLSESVEEQLEAQRRQVERLRAITVFNEDRVESMDVVAGVDGVLAELPLQEGQWVTAGGTLARIVQPGRLKAELRIPQTQAQDIVAGQTAFVDTRNDTIVGRVTRIDPAVQNGTVTIDITLPEELPRSARPDLSVDGTVEIERLADVVFMSRPAFGSAGSRVGIFRVTPDGEYAERVSVLLGRSSVSEMEVQEGLAPGEVVVLSDMSQWDSYDRVRIR